MGRTIIALAILFSSLLQGGTALAREPFVIFSEGTLTSHRPDMSVIEERQYICQRVCYPDENRIEESYLSWVGEDTKSLEEWTQTLQLDGKTFTLEREDCTDGKGELEGRMWSWDRISFSYLDAEGHKHRWEGSYSGKNCRRAGVILDDRGQLLNLLADESNVITDEQYVMLQAIYERIRTGHN